MIDIFYDQTIDGGSPPYSYTISSDVSCVSFTPSSGTSPSGRIQFEAVFDNENCIESSQIFIDVTDKAGCTSRFTIIPAGQCTPLTSTGISFEAPYTFNISAARPGCTNGLSFEWSYNEDVFIPFATPFSSAFTSEITLRPNPRVTSRVSTTPITVTVTDCFGCQETLTYIFAFCQPEVGNFSTELVCVEEDGQSIYRRTNLQIPEVTGCTGLEID
jgi:hypothetical protein